MSINLCDSLYPISPRYTNTHRYTIWFCWRLLRLSIKHSVEHIAEKGERITERRCSPNMYQNLRWMHFAIERAEKIDTNSHWNISSNLWLLIYILCFFINSCIVMQSVREASCTLTNDLLRLQLENGCSVPLCSHAHHVMTYNLNATPFCQFF